MGRDPATLSSERLRVGDSIEAVGTLFSARGWSDGLPIVPPTEERVLAMLGGSDFQPDDVIAEIPPRWAAATVEKIAINAVMAGCHPHYLPVLIASVRAMADERFNLHGIQTTTHPVGPMVVVNGPIRHDIDVNCKAGCLGPGWRANATIGRAIRLILANVGGARPGKLDKATLGGPSKYSLVFGENEEESPWEPMHVELGYSPEVSTVTIFPAEGPHNVNDHISQTEEGILGMVSHSMTAVGTNNNWYDAEMMLILSPEHAETVGRHGWTKRQVKEFVCDHARRPVSDWPRENREGRFMRMLQDQAAAGQAALPMVAAVKRPEDLLVVVAGGAGKHSAVVPSFGPTRSVTVPITRRDGSFYLSKSAVS